MSITTIDSMPPNHAAVRYKLDVAVNTTTKVAVNRVNFRGVPDQVHGQFMVATPLHRGIDARGRTGIGHLGAGCVGQIRLALVRVL